MEALNKDAATKTNWTDTICATALRELVGARKQLKEANSAGSAKCKKECESVVQVMDEELEKLRG